MSKVPELVEDWLEIAVEVIEEETALEGGSAASLGQKIVYSIVEQYAGIQTYIPVRMAQKISERDRQIVAEFDGTNKDELIKKYNISNSWFYAIVRRAREVQGKRFPGDPGAQDV